MDFVRALGHTPPGTDSITFARQQPPFTGYNRPSISASCALL